MTAAAIVVALILSTGCESKQAAPAAHAPGSAPATAGASGAIPAPPTAPRRSRAGIETAAEGQPTLPPALPPTHREAAATLVAVAPQPDAPARRSGDEVDRATSALAFVRGPWRAAATAGDPNAYTALLLDEFVGSLPPLGDGAGRTISRDEWATHRTPAVDAPVTLLLGSPTVRFEPEPVPRAVVTFRERIDSAAGCKLLDRTLSLADVDGKWRVAIDDGGNPRPCPAHTPADVAAAWRALVAAAATDDPEKIQLNTTGGIRVRDSGLEVASYSVKDLTDGDGRWLLKALTGTTAAQGGIRMVGDEAVAPLTADTHLVLRYMGGAWRLVGVDRETPRGAPPTGSGGE